MLRRKVWFPNMSQMIESSIKSCYAFQVATVERKRSPLSMSKFPEKPWSERSMYFYTLSNGRELLVLIDDHSRFPIVQAISSTSFRHLKPKLDDIISTYGIPDVIWTDNGPPFNGKEFAEYAVSLGFKQRKITPLWPEANGEAERFMRTIGKVVRTAKAEGKQLEDQLNNFLRNYRTSRHPSTGCSPSSLLFGRENRNKIPEIVEVDKLAKERMKTYADKRRRTSEINLIQGDQVLIKKTGPLLKKTDPQYEPEPLTIINIIGSMITAENQTRKITRNASFFRRFYPRKNQPFPSQSPLKPPSKKVTFAFTNNGEDDESDTNQEVPAARAEEMAPDGNRNSHKQRSKMHSTASNANTTVAAKRPHKSKRPQKKKTFRPTQCSPSKPKRRGKGLPQNILKAMW